MSETKPGIWVPVIIGIVVMLIFLYYCCMKQNESLMQNHPGIIEKGAGRRIRHRPVPGYYYGRGGPPAPPPSGLFGPGGPGDDEYGVGGLGNLLNRPRPTFHPGGGPRGMPGFMNDGRGLGVPWTERMIHRGHGGLWGDDDDVDIIERRPIFM